MDLIALEQTARSLYVLLISSSYYDRLKTRLFRPVISGVMKALRFSGITLTLYDYVLTFNDEIQYVWRGRKTWSLSIIRTEYIERADEQTGFFYLYTLNRINLTALRLWEIYILTGPRGSRTGCIAAFYAQVAIGTFLVFSSDIFITLRVYALTLRNKFIGAYFGTLALTRLALSLASILGKSVGLLDLPPIPIETFNSCLMIIRYQFKFVPFALGTVFDLSAFIVVVWCIFHSMGALKISAIIRTIATDSTIYFFAMVAGQIYSQLSYIFMEDLSQQFSIVAYGFINPILTMRFVVSLKRAADPDGGQEWGLEHFSSISFYSNSLSDTRAAAGCENIEMDPVYPPNNRLKAYEP